MNRPASTLRNLAPIVWLCAAVSAETTVTLSPTQDVYIDDSMPDKSFDNALLVVGRSTQKLTPTYRSLLRFDLSSIPAGAVITSASLRLNLQAFEGGGTQAIEIHRLTESWNAAKLSWKTQPAHAASAEVTKNADATVSKWCVFPVAALAQAWADGPSSNHGLMLVAAKEATSTQARGFASLSASDPSIRPQLEIKYAAATAIGVSPLSINFGDADVGKASTAKKLVTLKSAGGAPLRVARVESRSAQFHLSGVPKLPLSLPPGDTLAFQVEFAPTLAGKQQGDIEIESNAAGEPVTHVHVTGNGILPAPPAGPGGFVRGDTNGSGRVDLSDAIAILGCLFLGGACPSCEDAADANDDGAINISDPSSILAFLFLGSMPLPPPGACGPDPTRDSLSCKAFDFCSASSGLIQSVELDRSQLCPGETVEVAVTTSNPDGKGKPVEVHINGNEGNVQHLQFLGAPGPRRIVVAATAQDGRVETRVLTVEVQKCDPSLWLPEVRVAPDPFRSRTVGFVVANVARLALGAERFIWDFGDGEVEESDVPSAMHRYEFPALQRDEPYTVFEARVTVKPRVGPEVSTTKTLTVHNSYALDKQKGRIRPLVEVDERLKTIGSSVVGSFAMTNLEDEAIVFTERQIVGQPCDPKLDPRPIAALEKFALFLGTRERIESAVVLSPGSIPAGICGVAVHMTGVTRSGATAQASLYFEVGVNPLLAERERDYEVLQALNAVAGQRLVADRDRITDEQLYRLAQEGRIEYPLRGRFEIGGGGGHAPEPELDDVCTPGQPLPEGLTCAATSEWQVIHGHVANALKGDLVLSPTCGIIGAMLKQLPDEQLFSHVGIMTANGVEIAHSTASEKRIKAHRNEIEGPFGIRVPTGGVDPDALEFVWPGVVVQSVEDAFRGKRMRDPEGDEYRVGTFAWGPVSCEEDITLIHPRVVKPSRDQVAGVTQTLHDAAEEARRMDAEEGTHYSFFGYTDAGHDETDECAEAPHQYCQARCDHCIGTMCSSFVWRSFKNIGADLVEPEDAADPSDGLFSYSEEARRMAGDFLYAKVYNDVYEQADDFEDAVVDWLLVATRTANQLLNCFATGDADEYASTAWTNPGTGLTASPDDTQKWDRVYGETEDMVFRPAQWVRVYRVVAAAGTGSIRGQVVDLDGAPVEDAEVTVDVDGAAPQYTDADGRFELVAVPGGLRQVRATKLIDGVRFESCTVGADFAAPAGDCGLANVQSRQTSTVDLVLGPPPSSLRCVAISFDGHLVDDDGWSSPDEAGRHDGFGTVYLAPLIHIHDDFERHDHGQGTLRSRSSCVDDELYVTLDFDVALVDDNAVHVSVRVRLYEGASCSTADKNTDRTFDLGVIDAGATSSILDVWVENEDEGGDTASYQIVISNLQSDEC